MSRTCQLTGKSVMTGNNVSKANNRTRRRFIPNLQQCSLHSEILGMSTQFRVAVSTLRTVEKKGGLDAFLISSKPKDLPTKAGLLRKKIIKAKEKNFN